jgi:hypothetical protein
LAATAEEIPDEVSTGAQNDLVRATDIARAMVRNSAERRPRHGSDGPPRRFLDVPMLQGAVSTAGHWQKTTVIKRRH